MKKATLKPRKKSMTVVIGSSRLGASIASDASQNGIYTSIIDLTAESFRKLDIADIPLLETPQIKVS